MAITPHATSCSFSLPHLGRLRSGVVRCQAAPALSMTTFERVGQMVDCSFIRDDPLHGRSNMARGMIACGNRCRSVLL